MKIQRLRGRMIRQHYRTMAGCACTAWCDGYNECKTDETARANTATDHLAALNARLTKMRSNLKPAVADAQRFGSASGSLVAQSVEVEIDAILGSWEN